MMCQLYYVSILLYDVSILLYDVPTLLYYVTTAVLQVISDFPCCGEEMLRQLLRRYTHFPDLNRFLLKTEWIE